MPVLSESLATAALVDAGEALHISEPLEPQPQPELEPEPELELELELEPEPEPEPELSVPVAMETLPVAVAPVSVPASVPVLASTLPGAAMTAEVMLQTLLADPVLMDQLAKALVSRLGDQVLREIAWEVMPEMAERLNRY